jgi:hypothetical protein
MAFLGVFPYVRVVTDSSPDTDEANLSEGVSFICQ